jgi:hypothetical protein
MESAVMLQRLNLIPCPEWLDAKLKTRVEAWNQRLTELQLREAELREAQQILINKPTATHANKLERDAVEFATAVEALIRDGRELLEECWRSGMAERDRRREQLKGTVKQHIKDLAESLNVPVPDREWDPVYVKLADVVWLKPEIAAAQQEVEDIHATNQEFVSILHWQLPAVVREVRELLKKLLPAVSTVNF